MFCAKPPYPTQILTSAATATSSRNAFIGSNTIRGTGLTGVAGGGTADHSWRHTAAMTQKPANTTSTDAVALANHNGT